jgi:hypothetical protein
MEIQDVEPLDLANFPEMTEEELDHAHDIFMLTADNGHREMKPVQEPTPEQTLTFTADELFRGLMHENENLVNISMITDTGVDELPDENADNTNHSPWEEADQNDEQHMELVEHLYTNDTIQISNINKTDSGVENVTLVIYENKVDYGRNE